MIDRRKVSMVLSLALLAAGALLLVADTHVPEEHSAYEVDCQNADSNYAVNCDDGERH